MNLKKALWYLYIVSAMSFAGCHLHDHENPQDTVLKGNIGFACKGPLFLMGYADSTDKFLGRKSVLYSAKIEENGDYRFVFHPNAPNIYDLKSADSFLLSSIYLCPTNKLMIHFAKKYDDPVIDTSNMEGKYNDFRVKLTQKFYKENAVKQFYYIGANYITINQFDTFVQGRKKQMNAFFENYFKGQKISPDFKKYALSEIKYQYGIDKMMFLWKKRIKSMTIFPDSSYYKDITNKSYLENPDAMFSPAYYHYLNLYINNIYGQMMMSNQPLPKWKGKPMSPALAKYEIAIMNLKEPFFDIVAYNIIVGDMSDDEYKTVKANRSASMNLALHEWFENKYQFKPE